jgi:hypothetical protein
MINILPSEIIKSLLDYSNIFDIINFTSTSSYCNKFKDYKKKDICRAKYNKSLIKLHFSPIIVELMGGIKQMLHFPELKWKNRFMGSTSYIDGINNEDMSVPIMFGIDNVYRRPFISFKVNYCNKKTSVTTIFQRYSNNKHAWTHGTNSISFITESCHFMINGNIKHDYLENNIRNLINNNGYSPTYLSKNRI